MKKNVLVLSTLLLAVIPACAVDWQPVETNIPNFNLYIDVDSIKSLKDKEYVYAIKYNNTNEPEKVAYIKSNLYNNYIGIIQAGDFEENSYRPAVVLAAPHVFMKPINDNSFLTFTHKYLTNMSGTNVKTAESSTGKGEVLPAAVPEGENVKTSNIKPASYKNLKTEQDMQFANMQEYVASVSSILEENWNPPASGRKTQAIVIISAGKDGGLYGYHFAKSSGDEATDRSILSAIKQTVPFPKFAKTNKNLKNFQFVFDYGIFKKSVK